MQYNLNLDLTTSKMQTIASKISSKIIYAHMQNLPLDKSNLNAKGFSFALYDEHNRSMAGNIKHKIDLSKKIYKTKEGHIGVVDSSALGHLGVYHVAVEEQTFQAKIDALLKKTVIIFATLYLLLMIVGYWLATIFIKPIQHQREKLNNFIKDSTHELNTPITALLMSVESSKPLSQKSLKRIQISTKRISEIYKDLTYLFLREENREEQDIKELNLTKVLKQQYDYLEEFALKKKITMHLKAKQVHFKIDEESFIRLINNLLLNAIKYSKIGSNIEITLTKEYLSIKDEGIGIDKKELKDIFNRFHRATTMQGGFGVGLNIVKSICQTYNIKIDVKSKIAKGSTFTLYFPKNKDHF